jgi:hypothetical protein
MDSNDKQEFVPVIPMPIDIVVGTFISVENTNGKTVRGKYAGSGDFLNNRYCIILDTGDSPYKLVHNKKVYEIHTAYIPIVTITTIGMGKEMDAVDQHIEEFMEG